MAHRIDDDDRCFQTGYYSNIVSYIYFTTQVDRGMKRHKKRTEQPCTVVSVSFILAQNCIL